MDMASKYIHTVYTGKANKVSHITKTFELAHKELRNIKIYITL